MGASGIQSGYRRQGAAWRRVLCGGQAVVVCALLAAGCRGIWRPWEDVSPAASSSREFDARQRLATGTPEKGLAIGVRPGSAGSGLVVSVYLRNDADHPLTVYRSFRVDRGQFDADSDLFVRVADAETKEEARVRSRAWTTGEDHHNPRSYYQMAPQEVVSATLDLGSLFEVKRGRSYDVTIEYDHRETGFEQGGRWVEMNAWKGRCRSNPLQVTAQ